MTKKRNITSRLNKVDYLIFSICSVLAITTLVMFYIEANSILVKQNEKPVAVISEIENKVQRKLVDHNVYDKVRLKTDIYDGDILRTEDNSKTVAQFLSDESSIELGENSIIQIFQNKKKNSIDFIGGEIALKNNSVDSSFIIHAGLKDIEIKKRAEVRITVVNHPVENVPDEMQNVVPGTSSETGILPADESSLTVPVEAVIDVVSGEVEVSENEKALKEKAVKDKTKPIKAKKEKKTVTAGNTVTLDLTKPAESETAENSQTEIAGNNDKSETPADGADIEVPSEDKKGEDTKSDTAGDSAKENAAEEIPENPIAKEVIAASSSQTFFSTKVKFAYNIYDKVNNKRNYQADFMLSEVLPESKRIPKGAAIEFTVSGTPDSDIPYVALQVSTGRREWKRAHEFRYESVGQGSGFVAGERFKIKRTIVLTDDIINTNTSYISLSYEPYFADKEMIVEGFSMSAKIVSPNAESQITPVAAGYTKTLELDEIQMFEERFTKNKTEKIKINLEDVFGGMKSIPAGTQIKVSVSGKLSDARNWLALEISEQMNDVYINALTKTNSETLLNLMETAGLSEDIKFSKTVTTKRNISLTNNGNLVISTGKQGSDPLYISDFKLTVEVIQ